MAYKTNPFTVSIFSMQDMHPMQVAATVSGQTLHTSLGGQYVNPMQPGGIPQHNTFAPLKQTTTVAWSDLVIPDKSQHPIPPWLELSGRSSKSGAENTKKTIRNNLWSRVFHREAPRKDAQFARLFEIACPKELTAEQIHPIAIAFASKLASQGMVVDMALHQSAPNSQGFCENTLQMLTTLRTLESGSKSFGNKKREWNERTTLIKWRADWFECLKESLPLLPATSQTEWSKKIIRFTNSLTNKPVKQQSPTNPAENNSQQDVPNRDFSNSEFEPTDKLQRILRL